MLFDLEDYIRGGVIGLNTQCVDCTIWEDMRNTAEQTKLAYFKALNEWHASAVDCLGPSNPCKPEIDSLWAKFQDFLIYYNDVWDRFWSALGCNGTFTDSICNEYRKAMVDLKCIAKQMMRLFDNDFSTSVTQPTEPCVIPAPGSESTYLTDTGSVIIFDGVSLECCTSEIMTQWYNTTYNVKETPLGFSVNPTWGPLPVGNGDGCYWDPNGGEIIKV